MDRNFLRISQKKTKELKKKFLKKKKKKDMKKRNEQIILIIPNSVKKKFLKMSKLKKVMTEKLSFDFFKIKRKKLSFSKKLEL